MFVLTALIAGCFAAQQSIGFLTAAVLSLMCVSMFFQLGLLAIFFWYLSLLMLAGGNQFGGFISFGLSILIATSPWLNRLIAPVDKTLVEHHRLVD